MSELDDNMQDTSYADEEALALGFDELLEGVAPAPAFIDPVTGIFYLRPCKIELRKMDTEDGLVLAGNIVYQIVSAVTNSPDAKAAQNGLLGEMFRMGGNGIKDSEKMSAARQAKLGAEQFLGRVKELGADMEMRPREDAYMDLVASYHPSENSCMKVSIKAKEKDGYVNIRQFKVLATHVDIDEDVLGDNAEGYSPWLPMEEGDKE